jgi:hypothetical protein
MIFYAFVKDDESLPICRVSKSDIIVPDDAGGNAKRLSGKREGSCIAGAFPFPLDGSGDLPDQYDIALR